MAFYYKGPSHTFSEYLLVPGYSNCECQPKNVSLKTPLVKFKKGEEPTISLNIPMVSAIMQSVSNDTLAIALAKEGVDSYVPYAGSLKDNAEISLAKIKSTMCNFGALTISELQQKAKLTLVSTTSIVEGGAHDVVLKDKSS